MPQPVRIAGYALVTMSMVAVVGWAVVDRDWGGSGSWLMLTWLAGCGTTGALLVGWAWRRILGDLPHVLTPVLFAVVVPPLVAAGGPARDRAQTTALWVAMALLTHVVLAVLTAPRRGGWLRAGSLVLLALAAVAAVSVERARQVSWRAGDFRVVGVPLVAPQVPGYSLSRAEPGRYSIFLVLAVDAPAAGQDRRIDVQIGRATPTGTPGSCRDTRADRFASPGDGGGLVLCLGDHAFQMWLSPAGQPAQNLKLLLDQVTLQPITASRLARYPASWTWEAD